MNDKIVIRGARENNLKHVSLDIPKHKLVVLTGPSGSGKSTLAMDTLQRECQRQYMESMGMAADQVGKPKVDSIVGLSPSISVGQHVTNRNPRSTVGTVTDIYTYLRVVYEKLGERPCSSCGRTVPPSPAKDAESPAIGDEDGGGFQKYVDCPHCGHTMKKLERSHFSFNKPEGACETCSGLGSVASLDLDAVFNPERSLLDGGVTFWFEMLAKYQVSTLAAAASHYGIPFDPDKPLKEFAPALRDLLYYGVESEEFVRHVPGVKPPKAVGQGKFEGVVTGIWRRYKEKNGESGEAALFHEEICPDCRGARLKRESLLVRVNGASIADVSGWSLETAFAWLNRLLQGLGPDDKSIAEALLHDLLVRLRRITDVGLGYLSLDRQAVTLSGGEAQRLRLASILGSGLTGVLYILDEPTAGLHPRDTAGLIQVLKQLRDLGNTVLVIEHDVEMMRAADHVIDMGPGAGSFGGRVVGQGTLDDLVASPESVTGAYLRDELARAVEPRRRRPGNGRWLTIHDAYERNLKHITVSFPLGCLVSVTGVSGSGKSTLLFDLLAAGGRDGQKRRGCERITGLDAIGQMVTVDQSPIGRMSRSNVATYTDVFTLLRSLFAGLPEAKSAKLTSKHFSFNTPGGRCETCQGLGVVSMNMHFLPDLEVRCPDCRGRRFKDEVLRVIYKGFTISDLLDMTVQESLPLLQDQDKIAGIIGLLCEVGLGYLQWGQSVRTLSGGEGQRLRLAKELSGRTKNHTLYLLDEPSTGLHPADTRQLVVLLNKLVDAGNTVIVVEHNVDVIRESDWVVDIGPEGGEAGGSVVAAGTPETVAAVDASHTGRYLKTALAGAGTV
ncbi:excinuclease ABC subunit UvrA [Paenibacillus flagellatus]|uniref:UvrABC system protein A n=1 Tax=Paenibacillus flagellatus TaxID=2211139 RepID=A0A2V5K1M8_9BACL|nr:excinuclease ABC subunit UvrA [Paenibacillus flagellatus]PYI51644.1 excinuclease ABC subunit A [Paenibacillus flagellatus]